MCARQPSYKFVVIIINGRTEYDKRVSISIFRCEWAALRVCSPSSEFRYHFFLHANRITSGSFIWPTDSSASMATTTMLPSQCVAFTVWSVSGGFDFNRRDSGIHTNEGSLSSNNNNNNLKFIHNQTAVACCVLFDGVGALRRASAAVDSCLADRHWENKWICSPSAFVAVLSRSARELLSNSFRFEFNYK